jgi:dihydropteroate synthase type 2
MGYFLGAGPGSSVAVLQALGRLEGEFGLPVLVSVSRKSFLGTITGRAVAERGPATIAAELFAVRRGAAWLRTHDVRALRDALAVERALGG